MADDAYGTNAREVAVAPVGNEMYLRYRAWVDGNRASVDEATDGRIGYLHIPDMGLPGAIEFHRNFLLAGHAEARASSSTTASTAAATSRASCSRSCCARSSATPHRAGATSRARTRTTRRCGPIVVLTNENAGSDGDIFSQAVKATGLGPLIGMRTWGGVVGIDRAKDLVDGGFTTQPEYAFWFHGVGWSVENHGVEPDIVVDRTPTDAFHGRDPQLERAHRGGDDGSRGVAPDPAGPGPPPEPVAAEGVALAIAADRAAVG